MSTAKAEDDTKGEAKPKGQSEYVSMTREDYKRIKDNFSLLKAKFQKAQQQNQSFQNLYATLSLKDDDIKMYRERAHRFELDFMRSQAQLSNLALKIGQHNGGKNVDFSGILEVIKNSTSTSDKPVATHTPGSIPKTVEQENKPSEISTKDSVKLKSRGGNTSNSDIRSSGKTSSDIETDSADNSGVSQETINKVIRENTVLRKKIQDFENNVEAWKNFKTHDEQMQLIEELRLELARVQVHNSELKMLLKAKQNDNVDALTEKLNEYMAKMQKSEKQLLNKQALLNVVEKEYRRIKVEHEKLSCLQERQARGAMGGDEHQTSIREQSIDDAGYISSGVEVLKQLTQEKEHLEQRLATTVEVHSREQARREEELDELRDNKLQLEQQVEGLKEVIETLQRNPGRSTVDDKPITRAAMQEENQRLRDRIKLCQQEQQEEKKNYSILEGQMNNVQLELARKIEDLQRLQQEFENLRAHTKSREEEIRKLNRLIESKQNQIIELSEEVSKYRQTIKEYNTSLRQGDGRSSLSSYSDDSRRYAHHPPPSDLPWNQPPSARRITAADGIPQSDDASSQRMSSLPSPEYVTPQGVLDRYRDPSGRAASAASSSMYSTSSRAGNQSNVSGLQQRLEMSDGTDASLILGDTEAAFKCERCYRTFESHEEFKYKDHIRKCQD